MPIDEAHRDDPSRSGGQLDGFADRTELRLSMPDDAIR
jgi:hypothetical protein